MTKKDEVEKQMEEMPIIKAMRDYINPDLNYKMAVQLLDESLPVTQAAKRLTETTTPQQSTFPSFEEMPSLVNANEEIISLMREINRNNQKNHEEVMAILKDILTLQLQQVPDEEKPHIFNRIMQGLSSIGVAVDATQSIAELITPFIAT